MDYRTFSSQVYPPNPPASIPTGHIQWKGTSVCIDLFCSCGHMGHFDGDFFYFFECPACKAKFAVDPVVRLLPLNEEQCAYVLEGRGFDTCELDTDPEP